MVIGEKMSEVTDMKSLVNDELGDVYEDFEHFLMKKPLDLGRLMYVKLRRGIPDHVGVEIWWNHFDDHILAQVQSSLDVYRVGFKSFNCSRDEMLRRIDALVEQMRDEINAWLL